MTRKQQRIFAVIVVLLGAGMAVGLSLSALKGNVSFFYSPSDIIGADAKYRPPHRVFRLGGLVENGSLKHGEGMRITFTITDNKEEIVTVYDGIVPDLFREGQGVVATGKLDDQGRFIATRLLAKHDEKYMPPEVARALKKTAAEKGHPGGA